MSTTITKRSWARAKIDADAFRALFSPETYDRWEIAGSERLAERARELARNRSDDESCAVFLCASDLLAKVAATKEAK